MCFYEQYRFTCGDFKWGNFRLHCHKKYGMGEVCGMKIVHETTVQPIKCKMCQKADKKLQQREVEAERVVRWQREGKNPASVNKAMDVIKQLDTEISAIYSEISSRRMAFGGHGQRQQQYAQQPQASNATHSSSHGNKEKHVKRVRRIKSPLGLPVTFGEIASPATVMACADTGSCVNAISADLASALGLSVEPELGDEPMKTQIGSGKWITSCGKIVTACTLDSVQSNPSTIVTVIYVFKRLTRPGLIFSRGFIRESSAFARKLMRPRPGCYTVPCVRAIGDPTRLLSCNFSGQSVTVFPDTGSEIDLISQEYAEKNFKFGISPSFRWVQYADGSIEKVCGMIRGELAIGKTTPIHLQAEQEVRK